MKKTLFLFVLCVLIGIIIAGCQVPGNIQETIDSEKKQIEDDCPSIYPEGDVNDVQIDDNVMNKAAGRLVGENYIYFEIDTSTYAGSSAESIYVYFKDKKIRLYAKNQRPDLSNGDRYFGKGDVYKYNLNTYHDSKSILENMPQDNWDDIKFYTSSTDGIIFRKVKIVHSGQVILDYKPSTSLDYPHYKYIHFEIPISNYKLKGCSMAYYNVVTAMKELGKTDGSKYQGGYLSWNRRFAVWSIFEWDDYWGYAMYDMYEYELENWFRQRSRRFTKSDVLNRRYSLRPGDYICIDTSWGSRRSVIFKGWIGDSRYLSENTRMITIEGDPAVVKNDIYKLGEILYIGKSYDL